MSAAVRLLPYADADGASNMAADETLLHTAVEGTASLRLYGWTEATLSLGYFQPSAVRLTDARLAPLPWVRRSSGGGTLVHHHELTYALALPFGNPWHSTEPWMSRMHRIITSALGELGLAGKIEAVRGVPIKHGDVLCFQQHTPGDLLSDGRKIVGSAQRKHHQALMQHGSILLATSEHSPALVGIRELTGVAVSPAQLQIAILSVLAFDSGWAIEAGDWTCEEKRHTTLLALERYANAAWNEKR